MGRMAQTIRKHDWNTDTTVLAVWLPHTDRCSAFFQQWKNIVCSQCTLFLKQNSMFLSMQQKQGKGLERKIWMGHFFSKDEVFCSCEIGPLRQLSSFTSPLLLCKNAPIMGKYYSIQSHSVLLCGEFINEKQYSNMIFVRRFQNRKSYCHHMTAIEWKHQTLFEHQTFWKGRKI